MQFGWSLTLVLDAHGKRAREAFGCSDDVLRDLASNDPVLRRVPHLELASRHLGRGDNFEIGKWNEVPDFQLALAYDCERWRLHTSNPDHASRTPTQGDGCSPRERQVVDLIGLPARDGGGVKASIFGIGPCPTEGVPDGLRVLCRKQDPHDFAAIFVMFE